MIELALEIEELDPADLKELMSVQWKVPSLMILLLTHERTCTLQYPTGDLELWSSSLACLLNTYMSPVHAHLSILGSLHDPDTDT